MTRADHSDYSPEAVEDEGIAISEKDLEAARSDREGAAWWAEDLAADGELEAFVTHRASDTPLSVRAFDLIVEFEVTSKATYEAKYRGPIWPEEASGVTVGIGYDVGYATKAQLHSDWDGAIPSTMIAALETALGLKGPAAKPVALALRSKVDIPWSAAVSVHSSKVMPRWMGLVEDRLPNTAALRPDSLGALVSLTYNRGASFGKDGDRYREMRAILQHMRGRAFHKIPAELRAMKRLWPHVPGLQGRREREARLFERGLAETPSG